MSSLLLDFRLLRYRIRLMNKQRLSALSYVCDCDYAISFTGLTRTKLIHYRYGRLSTFFALRYVCFIFWHFCTHCPLLLILLILLRSESFFSLFQINIYDWKYPSSVSLLKLPQRRHYCKQTIKTVLLTGLKLNYMSTEFRTCCNIMVFQFI